MAKLLTSTISILIAATVLAVDFPFDIAKNKTSRGIENGEGLINSLLLRENYALAEQKLPYSVEHKIQEEGGTVWTPSLATQSGIIAYVTPDNLIYINDNGIVRSVKGYKHEYKIQSIAISNDGKYLVTGDGNSIEKYIDASVIEKNPELNNDKDINPKYSIAIWDIDTGNYLGKVKNLLGGHIKSLDFSPGDEFLASAHGGRKIGVLVWNFPAIINHFNSGKTEIDYEQPAEAEKFFKKIQDSDAIYSESVAFDPQGKWVATSGSTKNIKFFQIPKLYRIKTINLQGAYKGASQMAINSQGDRLAAALRLNDDPENKGVLSLWNIEDFSNISEPIEFKSKRAILSVSFSADDENILVGTEDGKAKLWSLKDNSEIANLDLDAEQNDVPPKIGAVAFLPSKSNQEPSFLTASSTGAINQWKLTKNIIDGPPPPCKNDALVLGIILTILSLIGFVLLYRSHKNSLKYIGCFLDATKKLVDDGKKLQAPLEESANDIHRSGKSIGDIADNLGEADLREICIQKIKDNNVVEKTEFDLGPLIDNLRGTKDSIYKIEDKVKQIAKVINTMFGDVEDDLLTKEKVSSIIHPIYLLLLLSLLSLFSLGLFNIAKSRSQGDCDVLKSYDTNSQLTTEETNFC